MKKQEKDKTPGRPVELRKNEGRTHHSTNGGCGGEK